MPTKKSSPKSQQLSNTAKTIERRIYLIREQKVMLDSDLAKLYGVQTKVFNQAAKRNLQRFPPGSMFQLTDEETESLRSQFVTSKTGRGGRRCLPYVGRILRSSDGVE